jgi:hypothetical protein
MKYAVTVVYEVEAETELLARRFVEQELRTMSKIGKLGDASIPGYAAEIVQEETT